MENTPRSYVLTLLTLMGGVEGAEKENPPLGMAICWGKQSSIYNLPAHRLLQALIEHPSTPEANQAIAQEFLTELAKCENSGVIELVRSLNNLNESSVSPSEWAAAVCEGLIRNGNILPLTDLATSYLNNLVIPILNLPGGRGLKARPGTPALKERDSDPLLQSANVAGRQRALKKLVFRRDGNQCPITQWPFSGMGRTTRHCSRILPFSIYAKTPVHTAIEMFTGKELKEEEIQPLINNPANVMNLNGDAHVSLDEHSAWGIEAKQINNEWKYYYRIVKPADIYRPMVHLEDGHEIKFGKGDEGNSIPLPDPRICNLRLAISRVLAASGFAELIDQIFKDRKEP